MSAPVDWLLVGEPWVEYRTRLDLLGQSENDQQVNSSRKSMLANAQVQNLVTELSGWPGTVISSHKSASQSFHKLTFIADLGFTVHDPGVDTIVARILEHQSAEGPFQLPMNIPTHYGGSGHNQWAWAFSKELGKFRGPGRKDDPCPFANLAMLKALSEVAELRDSPACHTGADTILNLWSESTTQHPYMFYMGTDFRKLKVPFVWYDLIHVLDVLSRFSWLKNDKRFLDMLGILECKADLQGCFTLESIWTAWKDWEFGQKKMPSRWLTLLAWRIFRRVETASK